MHRAGQCITTPIFGQQQIRLAEVRVGRTGHWVVHGLCQHLWEHYQFTGDKKYLKEVAYPIMKDAAVFCEAWLIEDKNGKLVTAPSTSPENIFITESGFKGSVSVATTMDMSLIWDLFTNVIQASEQLGIDASFRNTLVEKTQSAFSIADW